MNRDSNNFPWVHEGFDPSTTRPELERDPYTQFDPFSPLSYNFSGYTGPATGYDTPAELNAHDRPSSPTEPEISPTSPVTDLGDLPLSDPYNFEPTPTITQTTPSPTLDPIVPTPLDPMAPPSDPVADPRPNVDPQAGVGGHYWGSGGFFGWGGNGGGGGDGYGGNGDYYGGFGSGDSGGSGGGSSRGGSGSSTGGGGSSRGGGGSGGGGFSDWNSPDEGDRGRAASDMGWGSGGSGGGGFSDWNGPDEGDRGSAASDMGWGSGGIGGDGSGTTGVGWVPVLLDISGEGLSVDELSSSHKFLDRKGDGHERRTAWAGKGTGVLVLDADGDGKISRSNEFVFTEWDSSANSDLEAIKNVFDTNGNGKLDSGDARWSEFKVEVDGQLVSLDSLGIVSIDLTATGSGQSFTDGSAITGTATFTRADGTTGTVGDAVLAVDGEDYIIRQSSTPSADGSTTNTILGYNEYGSLAFRNLVTTSSDGNTTHTQFDDDGNGTIDRSQWNVVSVDGAGARVKTVSNFNADGSLRDRTTTTTSAHLSAIATTIDQDGDGAADERQTFVRQVNGSTTTTTERLSSAGTVLSSVVIDAAADGLSKTSTIDVNGDGTNDLVIAETTVVAADGSRTRTVTQLATDGTRLSQTTSLTSADNKTKTVSGDADGNGSIDTRTVTETVVSTSGDITAQSSVFNGDGTLRGKSTSVTSASGLSKTVSSDITGDGVADRIASDVKIIAGDGAMTQTVQTTSADGTLLSKSVTTTSGDRKTTTIAADTNGDGASDVISDTVIGADGVTTTTVRALNADGSLVSQSVAVSSADGLSKTTRSDMDGNGTDDRTLSTVVAALADGGRMETATITSASGAVLGKTVTTTSADSLSQTVQSDLDGDGTFDHTASNIISLGADGTRTETVTVRSADGTLKGEVMTVVSADRKTTTVTTDADGDGNADGVQVRSVRVDGRIDVSNTSYAANGTVLATGATSVSADGLTTTSSVDSTGDGSNDRVATDQTLIGSDGSRTQTVSVAAGNGNLLNRRSIVTSGNGLSVTTSDDLNGDGIIDVSNLQQSTLNADGSVTKTVSNNIGTTLTGRSVTTVSASGLLAQTEVDADGNGTIDRRSTSTKTLNANGSTQTTAVVKAGNNALISSVTTDVSADGRSAAKAIDLDGNGSIDVRETISVSSGGVSTDTVEAYKANGTLDSRSVVSSAANGLSKTSSSDLDGNGVFDLVVTDTTTIDSNGGQTRTVSKFGAGNTLTSRILTRVSADGLTKTTTWTDGSGATVRSSSDVTIRKPDGGLTETLSYFKADGSLESKQITTIAAHGLTTTVTLDVDGNGTVDQRSISTKKADGSVELVLTDLASSGAAKDSKAITTSADGLRRTADFDTDGNGTIDKRITSVTVLNADGGKTTTTQEFVAGASGLTLKSTTVVDISDDGLTVSTKWDTSGSGSFDKSQTDITTLDADGSRTRTISTYTGASLASRYSITTSANGLSVTEKWDASGSGTYSQTATDVTTINADGTTTRTITNMRSDGTLISKAVTTTDVTGRVISTAEERPGFTNQSRTAKLEVLADGATRETFTRLNSSGGLIDKTTAATSADKLTVTLERDANGDGIVDQRQQTITSDAGILTAVTTDLKSDGTVRDSFTRTVSADGRKTTITWDFDGNGSADRRRVIDDSQNADGSRTTVATDTDLQTGTLSATTTSRLSADGRIATTSKDVNGDGTVDHVETTTTDSTGAKVSVVTNNVTARDVKYLSQGGVYWKQAVAAKTETATSLDGRTTTLKYDYDGDGIFETTMQKVVQIDGSAVTTITETVAGGAVKARGTIYTSADGLITKLSKDTDNNGTFDHTETAVTHADGSVTLTKSDFNTSGALTQTVVDKVNSLGSLTTRVTSDGQGRRTAQTEVAADGTSVTTTYDAASAQILTVTRFNKAGLPTTATLYDPLNTKGWSRVEQVFDAAGKKSSETQYGDDGTRAELTFYVATGAQQKIRYFNSAGNLTSVVDFDVTNTAGWSQVTRNYDTAGRVTAELYVNDNGTKTQINYDTAGRKTAQVETAVDGSTVTTSFNAAGTVLNIIRRTSAGVQTSATIYDAAGAQGWTRVEQQFDSAGRKTVENQYNDNGTRTEITFYVSTGAQQKVRYFNSANQLTSSVDFDVADADTWSQITKNYNTAGQLTAQVNLYDDGVKYQYTYDPTDVKTWSTYAQRYNSAGKLYFVDQTNDDGTHNTVNYDVDSNQTWIRYERYKDAAGNILSQTNFNDDGVRHTFLYDVTNAQTWSRQEQLFDSSNRLYSFYQLNDNGTQNRTDYDVTNAAGWHHYDRYLDAAGNRLQQTNYNDDGSRNVYHWDVPDAKDWSSIEQRYNSAGAMEWQFNRYDTGNTEKITYDVSNTQPWSKHVETKNAAGAVLTSFAYFADNSTHRKHWDPNSAQPWSHIEQWVDASGKVTAQYKVLDNGTIEEVRSGGPTAKQVATFDPNYYLAQNPDLAANWHAPPIEHFNQYGWKEGRKPNAWFDPTYYLNQNPDIKNAGLNPFLHWKENGHAEGRLPYASYKVFDARRQADLAGISEPAFADLQLARIAEMRQFAQYALATAPSSEGAQLDPKRFIKEKLRDIISGDNREVLASYPEYVNNRYGASWARPVALDLNGDQHIDLRMFSPAEFEAGDGPRFDLDGDGVADGTAWVGPSDGWLTIDLAADGGAGPDGVINQARELAFTMWKTPGELADEQQAITDLEALRLVFDTNHNNVLDAGDERWSEFRIWQDANQNGITDAGELRTLDEADIRLIGLVPSSDGAREFADGSMITGTSSYLKGDGTSALVGDVTLNYRHVSAQPPV